MPSNDPALLEAPDKACDWRWTSASCVGVSHLRVGRGCDDAHLVERVVSPSGTISLLLAVSDGAGSAEYSSEGAQIAVDAFVSTVRELLIGHPLQSLPDLAAEVVDTVRYEVALRAMNLGVHSRQCACTLLGAVLGYHESFFLQLGDGAIVTRTSDADGLWQPVFWPQQGEYANTTYFVTQADAGARVVAQFEDGPLADIAMFTDGLQGLSLKYEDQTAHQPFFDFAARDVLSSHESGRLEDASERLSTFLCSDQVNSRTDDDKTLIVASKRLRRAAG